MKRFTDYIQESLLEPEADIVDKKIAPKFKDLKVGDAIYRLTNKAIVIEKNIITNIYKTTGMWILYYNDNNHDYIFSEDLNKSCVAVSFTSKEEAKQYLINHSKHKNQ